MTRLLALVAALSIAIADHADRRVVDVVQAGDATSEAMHGFAGHESVVGTVHGVPVRWATGWMRYAMHIFDDTEVTVEMTFAPDSVSRHFDVVVEDSVVARRTVAPSRTMSLMKVEAPFTVTKGKASIVIVLRARDGATPALRELRTVQEHNEL